MIYQLPNGKVINLSVEEYLDLTDHDIQYLISVNAGDHVTSPFYGSSIKNKGRKNPSSDYDKSIDYTLEDEDKSHGDNPGEDEISTDEFLDFPDTEKLD